MKYRNYKSAIHNFAHSLMSLDYMKSGELAINILIDMHNQGLETQVEFNFINKTIEPNDAESEESRQLLCDYLDWLPKHFEKHNCDLLELEKLEVTIKADFKNTVPCDRNQKNRIFQVTSLANWKSKGRNEEFIEICQPEVMPRKLVVLEKIPRIKNALQ